MIHHGRRDVQHIQTNTVLSWVVRVGVERSLVGRSSEWLISSITLGDDLKYSTKSTNTAHLWEREETSIESVESSSTQHPFQFLSTSTYFYSGLTARCWHSQDLMTITTVFCSRFLFYRVIGRTISTTMVDYKVICDDNLC